MSDKVKRARELNLTTAAIRVGTEIVDLTALTPIELRAFKAEYPGIVLDPEKEKKLVRSTTPKEEKEIEKTTEPKAE